MLNQQDVLIEKANILIEALPYIQHLAGKCVVVKYGGNAMLDERLTKKIMQDITLLKYVGVNPIVVHGGGPEINKTLAALNIESHFHNGLRVTDDAAMEVVQMVLTGKINKDITAGLNALGARAIGLCGIDANLIRVVKKPPVNGVDLGRVGQVVDVNTKLLKFLSEDEYIPVIAPIGVDEAGNSYNINADTVAGVVAARLAAEKLMFLTDVDGIREDPADPNTLLSCVTREQAEGMIEKGAIDGGMIPKVRGCLEAVAAGVRRAHILNGTIEHPILLEIFTREGIGTMVTTSEEGEQWSTGK